MPQDALRDVGQPVGIARLIAAIGTERFGIELAGYLGATCSVDYCSTFELVGGSLRALSFSKPAEADALEHLWQYARCQLWRRDQALLDAWSQAGRAGVSTVRVAPDDVKDRELRLRVYPELVDRLLLCLAYRGSIYGVSLLRWSRSARFAAEEVHELQGRLGPAVASIERHARMSCLAPSAADALGDVAQVERCLGTMGSLPAREREVCARTVCGRSATQISQELGISPETVKCYRGRAYIRLGIAGERELLVLFVRLWESWRHDWLEHGRSCPTPLDDHALDIGPRRGRPAP